MTNFDMLTNLTDQLAKQGKYKFDQRPLTIQTGVSIKSGCVSVVENRKNVTADGWLGLVKYLDAYSGKERSNYGRGFIGGNELERDLVTIWVRDVSDITESVVMGDTTEAPYAEMTYVAEGSSLIKKDMVIIVPLSRSVNAEEYTKVAQVIAYQNHLLGDGLCARASFEASGAVPWPTPKPIDGFLELMWRRAVSFDNFADVEKLLKESVEWE